MEMKFYVSASHDYLGGFDGAEPPAGAIEVPQDRPGPGYTWDGSKWTGPSAEFKLADLRAKRDAALAACDWTQMLDSPLTDADKAAWATYRQALRDLPENGSAWPTEPVK